MQIFLRSFYFLRHGQTDWNKSQSGLCPQDDIHLNAIGLQEVCDTAELIAQSKLEIAVICSSPLLRAVQTAEAVAGKINVTIQLCTGLGAISSDAITEALSDILTQHSGNVLIVSHGEVYRQLLTILNVQKAYSRAKNGGLYKFVLDHSSWSLQEL